MDKDCVDTVVDVYVEVDVEENWFEEEEYTDIEGNVEVDHWSRWLKFLRDHLVLAILKEWSHDCFDILPS